MKCEEKAFHTSSSRALIRKGVDLQGHQFASGHALRMMLAECSFQASIALFFLESIWKQTTLPDMAVTKPQKEL